MLTNENAAAATYLCVRHQVQDGYYDAEDAAAAQEHPSYGIDDGETQDTELGGYGGSPGYYDAQGMCAHKPMHV